jgi:hypothetical protein
MLEFIMQVVDLTGLVEPSSFSRASTPGGTGAKDGSFVSVTDAAKRAGSGPAVSGSLAACGSLLDVPAEVGAIR